MPLGIEPGVAQAEKLSALVLPQSASCVHPFRANLVLRVDSMIMMFFIMSMRQGRTSAKWLPGDQAGDCTRWRKRLPSSSLSSFSHPARDLLPRIGQEHIGSAVNCGSTGRRGENLIEDTPRAVRAVDGLDRARASAREDEAAGAIGKRALAPMELSALVRTSGRNSTFSS